MARHDAAAQGSGTQGGARTTLHRSPVMERIATSRPLAFALIVVSILLLASSAIRFQAPELVGQHKVLTDFDAFHIAGRLAAEGQVSAAYHARELFAAQKAITGTESFMPWTYPPPFTLLMQGLAHLPIGAAFLLFMIPSFGLYLWVLRRIAGQLLMPTLVAMLPVILINLRTGQNGFLTAGLIGAVLLAFRDDRKLAGLPLGLMIVKPHLAAGIGILALIRRKVAAVTLAGAVAAQLLALSTWAYGFGIWPIFEGAVKEAGTFLAEGYYHLYRMNSVYAAAYSFGSGETIAMALQVTFALAALAIVAKASLDNTAWPRLAALTCAASLFVSPYGYDYDLTILSVGLAFVMPELLDRASGRELAGLFGLAWFASGYGLAISTLFPDDPAVATSGFAGPSLIAPALIALCWSVSRILRRESQPGEAQMDHSTVLSGAHAIATR